MSKAGVFASPSRLLAATGVYSRPYNSMASTRVCYASNTTHWPGDDYRNAHFARKEPMVTARIVTNRRTDELIMNTTVFFLRQVQSSTCEHAQHVKMPAIVPLSVAVQALQLHRQQSYLQLVTIRSALLANPQKCQARE